MHAGSLPRGLRRYRLPDWQPYKVLPRPKWFPFLRSGSSESGLCSSTNTEFIWSSGSRSSCCQECKIAPETKRLRSAVMGPVFQKRPYTAVYCPLGKGGVEFVMPPGIRIKEAQRKRLVAAVARLPVLEDRVCAVDLCATMIYWMTEYQRYPRGWRTQSRRKPVAAKASIASAAAYEVLTGLPVTRVSWQQKGKTVQQEHGKFASFLGEVFQILGIEASPAGQVRLLKDQDRERSWRNVVKAVLAALL